MKRTLLDTVRRALEAAAEPAKAPQMQAYMKSEMPYHGVPSPALKKLYRAVLPAHPVTSFAGWRDDVLHLWRNAKYREERYLAVALSGDRRAQDYQTPDAMPLYEEMIVDGAWWDYVDALAIHRVGPILEAHRKPMTKLMLAWSRCDDMWKRRTAIVCQVASKEKTDLDLMYRAIEPALDAKEFFLRKAIGWALRQHAWVDPKEVQRYIKEHDARLSPLSKREALINIEGRREAARLRKTAKT
jgi:3-methyladenine DNA glycosylase AlkD